jgi:hypothetical protein
MSGFTKGPWTTGNVDKLLVGIKRLNGTEPICFVYGPSDHDTSEVRKRALADAMLIAAAPDLYEALRVLLDAVLGNHVTVGDCNEARAALAKADGTCAD